MLGQAKSTTVVVPPRSADRLPEKKSSAVVVLHHGDGKALQAVCTALAQRPGPIVGVTAMQPGTVDIPLERLLIERALSVNTAAAGGNASLMTLG